jgi:hypothetical protein
MSELSARWGFLDQAATVHRLHCEALQQENAHVAADEPDLDQTSDQVIAYAIVARKIYDALKRVIGQSGGLLIIVQTTGKRETVDLPSLASAEDILEEAVGRLAALSAPPHLEPHRKRLEYAAHLVGISLAALRAIEKNDGDVNIMPALDALSNAYKVLQKASESRIGMTMVDFRHACCTCGALTQ